MPALGYCHWVESVKCARASCEQCVSRRGSKVSLHFGKNTIAFVLEGRLLSQCRATAAAVLPSSVITRCNTLYCAQQIALPCLGLRQAAAIHPEDCARSGLPAIAPSCILPRIHCICADVKVPLPRSFLGQSCRIPGSCI